ncbi:hypothetical protein PAXRUDRAFT_791475 [Paxillus rubicundulus Ve08.2h10]|uniref:Uncharacterized protein n=1 Tax=Paxillus rubicundulus Ve08.2h10 TaxID=930991 RepID=A0A0D0CT91_9AGAM|nr:hypothetical protein PAXRUDRAFT_791475 [Paxillus rubicundulus Ve08.2h10]
MPCMLSSEKVLLVISPLNSLEEDQACWCHKMGLTSVAVNHQTYTDELHEELHLWKYQVIYTSPEMACQTSTSMVLCAHLTTMNI